MYIDTHEIDEIIYNLTYLGNNTYRVLEGNKPTDIIIIENTEANAKERFHNIMEYYK